MNKYIYKVRFDALNFIAITRTKIMHKHDFFFGKKQIVQL